jgi:site-specific DNA-methyltransferase (adenine-specific)
MQIINGDCLLEMKKLPDNSVDSIVTDPPYGLSFMGKKWDYDVPSVEIWQECLRVLKPGGHLLAFAGTRTQHRMAVRIEDAGFEIRDMIAWVYGQGFPKSLDVSKAIDKAAGAEREVVGLGKYANRGRVASGSQVDVGDSASSFITAPATDAAKQWQGWGTALKPSWECVTMARKPLIGTVAENVLEYGTGAINVDGSRIGTDGGTRREGKADRPNDAGWENMRGHGVAEINMGRWPANLIHDGSEEVTGLFPGQDDKNAARFFYCAKANKKDRGEGNNHNTVKPTDLMRYLCKLVTRPGGTVLDPFMGSGSTGKGAKLEGFDFIGIELDPEYCKIAESRINAA